MYNFFIIIQMPRGRLPKDKSQRIDAFLNRHEDIIEKGYVMNLVNMLKEEEDISVTNVAIYIRLKKRRDFYNGCEDAKDVDVDVDVMI